jgi:hypothetical protein
LIALSALFAFVIDLVAWFEQLSFESNNFPMSPREMQTNNQYFLKAFQA